MADHVHSCQVLVHLSNSHVVVFLGNVLHVASKSCLLVFPARSLHKSRLLVFPARSLHKSCLHEFTELNFLSQDIKHID